MKSNYFEILSDVIHNTSLIFISLWIIIIAAGIIILKILIPLYKYNIRMKDFYLSRAETFKIAGVKDLNRITTIANVMATEKLDFEKDGLIELIETIKGK